MRIQNHQRASRNAGIETSRNSGDGRARSRGPAPPPPRAGRRGRAAGRASGRAAAPARRACQRLPAVAAQASPRVSFLPTAAAIVTWATMPVTRISPSDCSTVPSDQRAEGADEAGRLGAGNPSQPGSRDRSTDQVSTAVTTTGISIATAVTRTAEPTVAFGLKRMIRNAASYMSPSCSGRSGDRARLVGGAEHARLRAVRARVLAGGTGAGTPAGRTRAAGTAAGGTAGSGAAAASRAEAAGPHRGPAARRRWRPGEGRTRFPTPRHPLRAAARSPGFPRAPPARSQRIWPAPTSLPR